MIIFDGDWERIFRELREEDSKVKYYINKLQNGIVRKFRKTMTFPVWYSETITLPKTKNTYLVYYYAVNANDWEYQFNHFYGALLMLNDPLGHRMVVSLRDMTTRIIADGGITDTQTYSLQVYSGHFFSRYRERMGLSSDLSVNDVITTFFGRNGYYFSKLDYDKIVLEKNRHKGNCAYAIEEGVTLGEEKDYGYFWLFKHNTFLSKSALKDNQSEATPAVSEMRKLSVRH